MLVCKLCYYVISEIKPDYIILDEFHRCGAEFWGMGVDNLLNMYSDVPIVVFSATAIRYLDNPRDMSDELLDGNVASEITLGEAIVRGIFNPPKYVLSVFFADDLAKYQRRVRNSRNKFIRDEGEKYLEALRHAFEKADGLEEIFKKHIEDKSGKFAAAEKFYKENGHLQIPAKYVSPDGIKLGNWISYLKNVRIGKQKRGAALTEEQIARLDSIGMSWNSTIADKWEDGFMEAKIYAQNNGTLLVPVSYVSESGYKLGSWLQRQNKLLKNEELLPERKKKLDSLGVEWIRKDPWMLRYEVLLKYYSETGTLSIPNDLVYDGVWIGKWLSSQKKYYQNRTVLNDEQRALIAKLINGEKTHTRRIESSSFYSRATLN